MKTNGGSVKRAYNVNNIEISPVAVSQVLTPAGTTDDSGESFSAISISDLFDIVKKYDSEFVPLESSKGVNADGTPKVMYHGTSESFTIFDKKKENHRVITEEVSISPKVTVAQISMEQRIKTII